MKGTPIHKLYFYRNIQRLAIREFCGSWKEVWAKHIYPVYPMSYRSFMRILKEKDLNSRIREELQNDNGRNG